MPIEIRKDKLYKKRFFALKYSLLDELTEYVFTGKMSKLDLLLFLRISSFCWGKKNICTKTMAHLAAEFEKEKDTVRKSLKRLEKLKLIKYIYRSAKNGKIKSTTSFQKMEKMKSENRLQLPAHYKIPKKIKKSIKTIKLD